LTHVQDIQKGLQQSVQALNWLDGSKSFFLRRALLFERNCARIIDWEKNIMNAFTGQTFQMNQIINIKHVVEFTALSKSKIYEMINKKSKYYDPTFPQPMLH
jgi:prophage regulatory protein